MWKKAGGEGSQPKESHTQKTAAIVMTTIEERVRALEVSMESIDRRLNTMEKRQWILGMILIGACNAFDLVSMWQ